MLEEFLNQNISPNRTLKFSPRLSSAYGMVVDQLRVTHPNLDGISPNLDSDTAESVVGQFYKLMPAHFFKFYQSLVKFEQEYYLESGTTRILAWPRVTVLDVGCGSGTASLASLSLIEEYQDFLGANGRPLFPIQVRVIGFDYSQHMLSLYKSLLAQYTGLLKNLLIDVDVETVCGRFPQDMWRVNPAMLSQKHLLLLAMSNIIRPLTQAFTNRETYWAERIEQQLNGEVAQIPQFGSNESREMRRLFTELQIEQLFMLGVAVGQENRVNWFQQLDRLIDVVESALSEHQIDKSYSAEFEVRYENPRQSFYGRSRGYSDSTYSSKYYSGRIYCCSQHFNQNMQWKSILSFQNMKLAWARARYYSLYAEPLSDEVEISLWDYDIDRKLDRLRKQLLQKEWSVLNVENIMAHDVPKDPHADRPRAIVRIEEQICSTAILQVVKDVIPLDPAVSYSYHINNQEDEYLYQYWLDLWKRFVENNQKNAESRDVFCSDIQGYYQNIIQRKLLSLIEKLSIEENVKDVLSMLILRSVPGSEAGKGIIQGHIASGFWANYFLSRTDNLFKTAFPSVTFARYTDDMVCTLDNSEVQVKEIETELRKLFHELGLNLSPSKTRTLPGIEYIKNTFDDRLDDIQQNRFNPLIKAVYCLSTDYIEHYRQKPWYFVTSYRSLLRLIPIYITAPGLRRRIEQYNQQNIESPLLLPSYSLFGKQTSNWINEFRSLNTGWITALKSVKQELQDLFYESIDVLQHPQSSALNLAKAKRQLGFSSNRLCNLGLDKDIALLLTNQLISNPWDAKWAHILCLGIANSGYADLLIQIVNQSTSAYIRSHAIRAMAEIQPQIPQRCLDLIWKQLLSQDLTDCEKLKASEALIFADTWHSANFDACKILVEQETDPYIQKNLIVLIAKAFGFQGVQYVQSMLSKNWHPIVIDAIQWSLNFSKNSSTPGIWDEPDTLVGYYSKSYPILESDQIVDISPGVW